MTVLAIETSCDETSVAIVRSGRILSNVVSSQTKLHLEYGGVVPELATREHLRNLAPVSHLALDNAGIEVSKVDAVAATQGPGLPNALMIGFKAAQALAFVQRKPLFGIHHHEAHLYSSWISASPPEADFSNFRPNVSLIVSGGHTLLVHVEAELHHRVLGSTVDDAAGECFDKTAKLMGLPYPGGPEIDRLAEGGDPDAIRFPRPLLNDPSNDFSFSGLKTAVRYFLRDHPHAIQDEKLLRNFCASVQAAIVEVLVVKTIRAARLSRVDCITASGGVSCNRALRHGLTVASESAGLTLRLAPPAFCTDNAAMIGILAERKLLSGHSSTSLDAEVQPNLPL